MASRPELRTICKELGIDHEYMNIEEMTIAVRESVDERLNIPILVGNKGLSDTLLKFINEEYDYIFKNKDGELVNYKGEKS